MVLKTGSKFSSFFLLLLFSCAPGSFELVYWGT